MLSDGNRVKNTIIFPKVDPVVTSLRFEVWEVGVKEGGIFLCGSSGGHTSVCSSVCSHTRLKDPPISYRTGIKL